MNQQKLTIRFVLVRAKINKRGLCPLSCRLTLYGKRKAFATGQYVNPKNWNAKQQTMTDSSDGTLFNAQLELICSKLKKNHLSLQLEGNDFTVDDIYQHYLGKPAHHETYLIAYFNDFLKKKKKLIGIDIELVTWKKYYYACEQAQSFIKWKYKKQDLPLSKLKLQFLNDFEYFLKTEKNQRQVTVNKTLQRFRKPVKTAVGEGYLEKDPFVLHKPGRVRKEVVFLSSEELNLLEEHQFIQPRLQLVKDLFIFCCYTGLAYHEMANLKKEHIIKGFDGNEWIQMKRKKTGRMISVPLLPKAKAIIDHYKEVGNLALPRFSNQKINSLYVSSDI